MKIQHVRRNRFEMAAHDLSVKWKGQRPAFKNEWPDAIKTKATMIDYILFAAIFLFGVGMLLTLI